MGKSETLPTIWEIPDDLWERIEPVILELDPPKPKGRKRVDQRKMLEGVIFAHQPGFAGTARIPDIPHGHAEGVVCGNPPGPMEPLAMEPLAMEPLVQWNHLQWNHLQWNHLPKDLGDDSTIHRTFQRWVERGVLEGVWAVLIEECWELDGVNWEWQSADCSMGKTRFGGALLDAIPRTGGRLGARKASWSTGLAGH